MNEQEFLSLTGPSQRVYYKSVKIAVEYFDSMGNTVRLDGQLPDGRVRDVAVSAESEKNFLSGRLNGELRLVDSRTGNPLLVEHYRDGVLDGARLEYFADGAVKTEQFFRNGKLDGPSKEYYESGAVRIDDTYKDGLLIARKEMREGSPVSTARTYTQQPTPAHHEPLDADLQDILSSLQPQDQEAAFEPPRAAAASQAAPEQKAADTAGLEVVRKSTDELRCYYIGDREIAREKINKSGQVVDSAGAVPDGIVREYYKNGELKFEEQWRGGKLNGWKKKFDELGRVWAEENYRNEKLEGLVKIHNYFKDKVFEEEAHFSEGQLHGTRKTFYPNGVISVEENYVRGKLDGTRKSYYESGEVNTDENYKDDKLDGLRKRYYDNGKLWIEETYADGKLDGIRKDYYNSGKLRFEEGYKAAQLHGKRTFYYDNGLPMYEEDYMFGRMTSRQEYKENRFRPSQ